MRRLFPSFCCLVATLFAAVPARAQFTVDAALRTIETSKLKLQFDTVCPERVRSLWYKPFSTTVAINSEVAPWEISGQMIQGLWAAPGPIFSQATVAQSWNVVEQTASRLKLRIESQAVYLGVTYPSVRTDYTFFADSSSYQVERTLHASLVPMPNTSLQPYVLRLKTGLFNLGQFRNGSGTSIPVSYCNAGCFTADWDQRWTRTQGPGLACTIMYASANPHPMSLMGDFDASSSSIWTGPLTPTQSFTSDVTWRLLVHCSTTPDNPALDDAIYSWFDLMPSAGVAPHPPSPIMLAVSPNPARGAATVALTLPQSAPVRVEILDVAGRVVTPLATGPQSTGRHVLRWEGRDARGHAVVPGLYFVRVTTPAGEQLARLAWLR